VTGGWRKLHKEELRNLNYSSSAIAVIKSKKMRRVDNVGKHVGYGGKARKKGTNKIGCYRIDWFDGG
jgi:hypothetical protein